jgi:hypothetical protein
VLAHIHDSTISTSHANSKSHNFTSIAWDSRK